MYVMEFLRKCHPDNTISIYKMLHKYNNFLIYEGKLEKLQYRDIKNLKVVVYYVSDCNLEIYCK